MIVSKTKSKTLLKSKVLDKSKSLSLIKLKSLLKTKSPSKSLDKYKSLLNVKSNPKSKYKHQITDKTITKSEYKFVSKYIDLCNKCGPKQVFNPKTNLCIDINSYEARQFDNVIRFCDSYFTKILNNEDKKAISYILDLKLPFRDSENKYVTVRSLIPNQYIKHFNNTTALIVGAILLKIFSEYVSLREPIIEILKILNLGSLTPITSGIFNILDKIKILKATKDRDSLLGIAYKPFIVVFGFISALFIKNAKKEEAKSQKSNTLKANTSKFTPYTENDVLNVSNYDKDFIRNITKLYEFKEDPKNYIRDFFTINDAFVNNNVSQIDLSKIGLKHKFFMEIQFKFQFKKMTKDPSIFIKFYDKLYKTERLISLSEDKNGIDNLKEKLITQYKKYNKVLDNFTKELEQKQQINKNIIDYKLLNDKLLELQNKKANKNIQTQINALEIKLKPFTKDMSKINNKTKKVISTNFFKPDELTNYDANLSYLLGTLKDTEKMIKKIDKTNFIAYKYIITQKLYIIKFFSAGGNHNFLYNIEPSHLLTQVYYTEKIEQNPDIIKTDWKDLISNQNVIGQNVIENKQSLFITYPSSPKNNTYPSSPKNTYPSSSKASPIKGSPIKQDNFDEIERNFMKMSEHRDVNKISFNYYDAEKEYNQNKDNKKTFENQFFDKNLIYNVMDKKFENRQPKLKTE